MFIYLARYFEDAAFTGYFESRGSRMLKETFDIVPYCIFTPEDIAVTEARQLLLYSTRRKGTCVFCATHIFLLL